MRSINSCLLIILLPVALFGQASPDSAGTMKEPGFLLTTVSYTTNNNNTPLANAIRRPALLTNISYFSNFGLWLTGNYDKYLSTTTNTYEIELEAGYEKTFLNHFDLDFSYKRRFFNGDAAYEGIDYKQALALSGTYRLNNFSLIADNSVMIGPTKNYFLDLSLSYDFTINLPFFKSGTLFLSPTLSSTFGTTFWMSGTMGHVWGNHYGGGFHTNPYVPENKFDYQYTSLLLPLQFSLGSFILSSGCYYSIPSKTLKEQNWTNQFGFLVSLSYAINF